MASSTGIKCKVCRWEARTGQKVDTSISAEAWAERVDVHRTSITRHLGHSAQEKMPEVAPVHDAGYSFETDSKTGTTSITKRADRIIPLSEWLADLRADGQNPDDFTVAAGHSVWGQQPREGVLVTLYANKFSYTQKTKKELAADQSPVVLESMLEAIRSFTYIPTPVAYNPETAIIVPTDLQVGKVDLGGGSKETAEQALHSFHEFAGFVKEFRPQEIVVADVGDPIENVFNTSAQLGTNDLDLPHQIAGASRIFLEGIKLFAPLAPKVSFKAVSSNHGAFRLGPKAPGGDAHADFGIVIAEMLRESLTLNPQAFGHVSVQTPDPYMESLYFQTSGSDIGMVHSHQAGNVDKIGTWWAGQSHGNLPVAKARILLCGHWHSLRVQQSGDGRWFIVGPASDRGSTWYTNLKGEASKSGMLMLTTSNNLWSNLAIV